MNSPNIASIFSGGFVPASMMEEVKQDPEAAFIAVLNDYGLDVDHLAYETLTRVKTKEDKGAEKSGWYVFYPGGISSGAYGDWRNGEEYQTWCAKRQNDMSPAEWLENKSRMEKAKRERAKQIEEDQKKAAGVARDILSDAQPANDDHPYLKAKGVKSHGLSIHGSSLIIPAINEDGEITTVQSIDRNGNKLFLKGGKKSGSFFWIEGSRDRIYICEGYATGATISEVTGCAVVVAFDAGNLPKVAPLIREKFLSANIILAADNDQFKGNHNAGVKCAKEAAELIGADVVIPQFVNLASKPTDFNDLMALEGVDRVKQQISQQTKVSTPRTRFEFSRVDSLAIEDIDFVIDGYLESDSLDLIFGEPGCGKSFVSIDMACCVATGTPWHGHEVKKGLVIYIAGEGHNGLAKRFKAWEVAHGVSLANAPLYKSHRAAQLYDMTVAIEVAESVKSISDAEGVVPALIIVDTVARNMGGDENSTKDMNQFIEHLDALLRHPYKSAVMLVHHSGKASPGQARGSTALRGALDAEYQVEMDQSSKMIVLSNKKMKDGEVPAEKKFSIRQVGLGQIGKKGTEIMGAMLETVDISGLVDQVKEKAETLTKNQRSAIVSLEGIFYARKREGSTVPVTLNDWRDACEIPRNRFHEVKDSLVAKGKVTINSTGVVNLNYELVTNV